MIRFLSVFVLLCAVGCGSDGGAGGDGADGGGGGGDGDGGAGNGDGGGQELQGCKIVDLVFSLDGSGSMSEARAALSTEAFPDFATKLKDIGDGLDDYRIGVTDACPADPSFHTQDNDSNDCNFQSGETWMTSNSTALNDEFSCIGDVFVGDYGSSATCTGSNDDEQPALTAAAALDTGANPGFLRDGALLVYVAITDENQQHPNATFDLSNEEVFDRLVAIKGDVRKMVFLGIGGGGPDGCDDGPYGSADYSADLENVANRFKASNRGVYWDLCAGNLDDGLDEALQVIEEACEELPNIP